MRRAPARLARQTFIGPRHGGPVSAGIEEAQGRAAGAGERAELAGAGARESEAGAIHLSVVEEMIILLLGSHPGPIPSAEHLQKEMFMLTQANPKLAPLFRFEDGRRGPHSARLRDASLEPLHYGDAYEVDGRGRIHLTAAGRRAYDGMAGGAADGAGPADLIDVANLTRHVYDKLAVDELLLVVCDYYYAEHAGSSAAPGWRPGKRARRRLADSLLGKDFITPERHGELIAGG